MESFVWGEHFLTGLATVDKEHRHLINILNAFGTSLTENNLQNQDVKRTFKKLAAYTQYHFTNEEILMQEMNVDSRHLEAHRVEHQNFVRDVQALMAGNYPDNIQVDQVLLTFLIQWVAYHILGSDQRMARQVIFIRNGLSPEDAFLEEKKKESAPTEALLTALKNLYQQVAQRNRALVELNASLKYP